MMEIHLKIIGTLLIALALIHLVFPKYFNWKTELQSLSLINRQMMSIHTFFMRFTIDVLYVDQSLKVTCIHRNIKPWRLSWGKFNSDSCFEFQSPALTQHVRIGDFLRVSA